MCVCVIMCVCGRSGIRWMGSRCLLLDYNYNALCGTSDVATPAMHHLALRATAQHLALNATLQHLALRATAQHLALRATAQHLAVRATLQHLALRATLKRLALRATTPSLESYLSMHLSIFFLSVFLSASPPACLACLFIFLSVSLPECLPVLLSACGKRSL